MGPLKFYRKIGPVTYRLALPPSVQGIHDIFHESNLCRYIPDLSHVIKYEPLKVKKDLTYIEKHIRILERKDKTLSNQTLPYDNVLWKHHKVVKATSELKRAM